MFAQVCGFLFLLGSAAAPPLSVAPDEAALAVLRDQVLAAGLFVDADVQRLAIPNDNLRRIAIHLDGVPKTIELFRYTQRAPDFQLLVQDATGLHLQAPPPIDTYRGYLAGEPNSRLAASVRSGQIWALLIRATGEVWSISPIDELAPGAPRDVHVVARAADAIVPTGTCGSDDLMQFLNADSAPAEGGIAGVAGRTDIAFDADVQFFQANGSSVTATVRDIEMIMNQVGLIYQNQVSICYAIRGEIVRTAEPDPYSSSNPNTLLCQFRSEWNSNVFTTRDTAHLMTGRNLSGTTIGIAWTGVVCNETGTDANCTNNDNLAYGLSQSRFSATLVSRVGLTAHEIGHNWSACHCNQSSCTGGGADADCGIMFSSAGPQQSTLLFGVRESNSITSHRNSRTCLSSCLSTVFVDWRNGTGSETGSIILPYNTVDEGVTFVEVAGQLNIASGTYAENLTINKQVTLISTGGNVRIGN